MKRRKSLLRSLVVSMCCVLVMGMACPAFAADDPNPIDGVFVGNQTLFESAFTFADGKYTAEFQSDGFKITKEGSECYVTFGSETVVLHWWLYSGDLYTRAYCIGNPFLLDGELNDSGDAFVLCLNPSDSSKCLFVCTPSFYADNISGTIDRGFLMSFSVSKSLAASLLDDTSTVFGSAIGMVGTVANTFASYPILYLPIVIGLCGIGVAFFKRMRQ